MKNKVFRKSILILLVISLLLPIMSLFMISTSAAASGEDYYEGFPLEVDYDKYANYDEALEGETNTEKGADGAYTIPVSVNSPQITVLIHGLGGTASDWSNDFSVNGENMQFAYNGKSLVEKLRKNTNGVVYRAETNFDYYNYQNDENGNPVKEGSALSGYEQFKLSKCTANCTCNQPECECVLPYNQEIVTRITDISSHIILIYEPLDQYRNLSEFDISSSSNARVYNELNYVIDKIVYDVKQLNGGILPRINLIGHSRGGLTAMQYALDHPWLVDSLVTMGTPFDGSEFGSEWMLNKLGMSTDNSKGKMFSFGIKDVMDSNVYNSYREKWNSEYEEKYKHINFHAIVGLTTIDGLLEIAKDPTKPLNEYINTLATNLDYAFDSMNDPENPSLYGISAVPLGDLFVDYHSQGAPLYSGVKRFNRIFKPYNTDYDMRTRAAAPIPHNLEQGDKIIHEYILRNLSFSEDSSFILTSTGYATSSLINLTEDGTFTFPESHNDIPVTEIASLSFAGNTTIRKIIIPKTIKKIGSYAFANCTSLEIVEFADESTLEYIDDSAFEGCTSLSEITLPSSLSHIGEFAFLDCDIQTIVLGENLYHISSTSFAGASLEYFYVDTNNANYQGVQGILFDKAGTTLISYPRKMSIETISLPAVLTEISPYAFYRAESLTNVDCMNITYIPDYAFYGCTALATVTAPDVTHVGFGAFQNTAMINNTSSDFKSVGTAFLKYSGNEASLEIVGYHSISPFAFTNNQNLNSIILDGIGVIGHGAFLGCSNLENIYLTSGDLVYFEDLSFDCTSDNINIFVANHLISNYKSDELWAEYANVISNHETIIKFDSNGGNEFEDTSILYYDNFETLPTPVRNGYTFAGWMWDGTQVKSGDVWLSFEEEVTFTAQWIANIYSVTLEYNGAHDSQTVFNYTVNETLILPLPKKTGYTFGGWYSTSDFSGEQVSQISTGSTGDRVYYAKWISNSYSVTLNCNGGNINGITNVSVSLIYNEPFSLFVPKREGYMFDGWFTEKKQYTTDDGEGISNWDIPSEATLIAKWIPEKYYVQMSVDYTKNTRYYWLTNSGIKETKDYIEYGTEIDIEKINEYIRSNGLAFKEGHKFTHLAEATQARGGNTTEYEYWGGSMGDIGENETTTVIEFLPQYEKEYYYITLLDSDGNVNNDTSKKHVFGETISLGDLTKAGYEFIGLKIANRYENYILDETTFPAGSMFNYNKMPDLSQNTEEDGFCIYLEPSYSPLSIIINFNSDGGSAIAATSILYGTTAGNHTFSVPTRTGWTFDGWYYSTTQYANSNGALIKTWDLADKTTLKASWTKNRYTITYSNVNETYGNPSTYTVEDTFTLKNASKAGYVFKGWYTSSNFAESSKITNIPVGSTGNKVLYAKFLALYTVKFTDTSNKTLTFQTTSEDKITVPSLSEGYIYASGNTRVNPGTSYTATKNITFNAVEKTISECKNGSTYYIYTYNQFNSIRNVNTSGMTFVLQNSINLTGYWTPFPEFKGTFNGNGHAINDANINIPSNASGSYGLFSKNSGSITNLLIQSFTISIANGTSTAELYVGAIAGTNTGTVSYITANNLYLSTGKSTSCLGGIIGLNEGNCYNSVISSTELSGVGDMGAIVGCTDGGVIRVCQVYGDSVTISVNGVNKRAGGIVGYACGGALIEYCYVSGVDFIFGNYVNIDSDNLWPWIGYIVGYIENSTMRNVGVSACTMNYGGLPSEYWDWFIHHDPRANVCKGPNGTYGDSSNSTIGSTTWNGVL